MIRIEGGEFRMGSEDFYPEERPVRRVRVEAFEIDPYPVTNEEFAQFVDASGYVTVAERPIDASQYPGALPELCVPGSLVFVGPTARWIYATGPNGGSGRRAHPGANRSGKTRRSTA